MQASEARQIVICCDGTNNNLTGRKKDTNVVKLATVLSRVAGTQGPMLFYDPGVGNAGALPGVTVIDQLRRRAERISGLAFGRGVYENLEQCYLFLMANYRPGDQLYIFGFSRGSFTARSLAGLINIFGVLQSHMVSMVPTLIHAYFADRNAGAAADFEDIAKQSKQIFCPPGAREVYMQYVGVWDTVASVGLRPFQAKITAKPTIKGKRYLNVRHALALDEHRAQFKPRLYEDENGSYAAANGATATIEQRWFRGSHCDVGGGYGEGETLISDRAFQWIVSEAVRCGLDLQGIDGPLDTEEKVASALRLDYLVADTGYVHSELRNTCLWALAGMSVRDTTRAERDDHPTTTVAPVEHASVEEAKLEFPVDTVWRQAPRDKKRVMGLGIALISLICLMAWVLALPPKSDETLSIFEEMQRLLRMNLEFAHWQLEWGWRGISMQDGIKAFGSPRWALFFDLGFIGCYAYVLAWFAVYAFARQARLRRAGAPSLPLFNTLGWALPLMVSADLAEDFCTWLAISLSSIGWERSAILAGAFMTLFSILKFLGLAGVLALLFWPSPKSTRSVPAGATARAAST